MRQITATRTGTIISDSDLFYETLYTGDYGKGKNVKAQFLGYNQRIDKVENTCMDYSQKFVITVSSQKGCPMACNFCDCPKLGFKGNHSKAELISQIVTSLSISGVKYSKKLNLHFVRMGEPTFNMSVIGAAIDTVKMFCYDTEYSDIHFDEIHPVLATMLPNNNANLEKFLKDWIIAGYKYGSGNGFGVQFSINTLDQQKRDEMFRGKSLSLEEISALIRRLPEPGGPGKRKFTLNFAVTSIADLSVDKMNSLFDKDRCIIKITPVHETNEAISCGYDTLKDFDIYEQFENPLIHDGWDVIVSLSSKEEDEDRITCGNSLMQNLI